MGIHTTKYETKDGKTRKVKKDVKTSKSGAGGSTPPAGNNPPAGTPGKQGA